MKTEMQGIRKEIVFLDKGDNVISREIKEFESVEDMKDFLSYGEIVLEEENVIYIAIYKEAN